MTIKCSICGEEFKVTKFVYYEIGCDTLHTKCANCGEMVNIGLYSMNDFITDIPKMADFKILTKEEFLKSYSYITEEEYEATKLYLDWLKE